MADPGRCSHSHAARARRLTLAIHVEKSVILDERKVVRLTTDSLLRLDRCIASLYEFSHGE